MMRRKNAAVMLPVCMGIIMALAACTPNTGSTETGDTPIKIVSLNPKALLATDASDMAARTAAAEANDFAFRLSAALIQNQGDDNFVCSPYSVWMPLAALLNATNDENKAALLDALGAAGITEADMNRAASRLLYDLTKLENKQYEKYDKNFKYYNPLRIANAIFVDNTVTLRADFAQTFMDFYRGASINVDFASRNAVDAVNQWASDNTEGLITNLIQQFNPDTVAAIANAIYFSDRWKWEFDSQETKEDVFHAPKGDTTAWYMLREDDSQPYYEDDQVQAMPLSFKLGGGMYIILPRDGKATELLSSMTTDYFREIRSKTEKREGKLLLPRFSIENEIRNLAGTLKTLGIPLFDSEVLPITGLIKEYPLFISDAIQKAIIKVDEEGTTAAAVTVMMMAGTSLEPPPPPKPFEMICDKPFVFILYESTADGGDQILFTGVVNQP
jgi:serpin B